MGIFGNKFNTPLKPDETTAYLHWLSTLPEYQQNTNDYDMQGAFKAGLGRGGNGHFPDTFKKPNHMTFSDESIYSTPQQQGGRWSDAGDGNYVFWASPTNMQQNSPVSILDYFKRNEPGSVPVLPINYRLPRR